MSYSHTKSFNLTDSCPDVLSRNSNHLAVGAYNLDDSETQKKSGQIFVLDVENLDVVKEYNEVGAIFDLIWVDDVIYACNTERQIVRIQPTTDQITIFNLQSESDNNNSSLTNIKYNNDLKNFACTDSTGNLHLIAAEKLLTIADNEVDKNTTCNNSANSGNASRNNNNKNNQNIQNNRCINKINIETNKSLNLHDMNLEVWCCEIDKTDPKIIYTGGDDSKCKLYDVRTDFARLFCKREAGVTFVSSELFGDENLLAVGSYDSCFSVYDKRSSKRPVSEISLPEQGGCWRVVKANKNNNSYLVAGMYSGSHLLEVDDKNHEITLKDSWHEKNDGIIYGVEVFEESFFTCSFYGKTVMKYEKS